MTRLSLAVAIALTATTAEAQNLPCQTREQVLAAITAEDPMHQVWRSLDEQDEVIEVWANPLTDEWVMIVTTPNGVSCPVSSGVAFRLTQEGDGS